MVRSKCAAVSIANEDDEKVISCNIILNNVSLNHLTVFVPIANRPVFLKPRNTSVDRQTARDQYYGLVWFACPGVKTKRTQKRSWGKTCRGAR